MDERPKSSAEHMFDWYRQDPVGPFTLRGATVVLDGAARAVIGLARGVGVVARYTYRLARGNGRSRARATD